MASRLLRTYAAVAVIAVVGFLALPPGGLPQTGWQVAVGWFAAVAVIAGVRLESGAVGISVNKRGDFSVLMNEVQVVDQGRTLDIDIDLDDISWAENLVVRNVSPTGSSKVNVLAIGVS